MPLLDVEIHVGINLRSKAAFRKEYVATAGSQVADIFFFNNAKPIENGEVVHDPASDDVVPTQGLGRDFPQRFLLFKGGVSTPETVGWQFSPPREVLNLLRRVSGEDPLPEDMVNQPIRPGVKHKCVFGGTIWMVMFTAHL